MHRTGFFKSSLLVDGVNYLGLPFLAIYCLSMFGYPWIEGDWSWEYVQRVWDRWQTLNTGALAFVASLLAFNISRFNENRQREREFVAARAFLPSALSELIEYCSRSATVLRDLWDSSTSPLEYQELPSDYREVFTTCIRHAEPEVGAYISEILVLLQVHDARLRDAIANHALSPVHASDRNSLIVYIFRLGEIYSLIANIFEFARGQSHFSSNTLTWENFRSAYRLLALKSKKFL